MYIKYDSYINTIITLFSYAFFSLSTPPVFTGALSVHHHPIRLPQLSFGALNQPRDFKVGCALSLREELTLTRTCTTPPHIQAQASGVGQHRVLQPGMYIPGSAQGKLL